jgi:hypothetical protein
MLGTACSLRQNASRSRRWHTRHLASVHWHRFGCGHDGGRSAERPLRQQAGDPCRRNRLGGDVADPSRSAHDGGAGYRSVDLWSRARRFGCRFAGFLLIGLGASNIVPVFFRRAGSQTVMPPALAVGAITMTGYAGVLLGPALIGYAASVVGLPISFWILAGLVCLVPLTAREAVGSENR